MATNSRAGGQEGLRHRHHTTGLTVANILGVPFGTWLGQAYGWRATFWAVTVVGAAALAVIALFVPKDNQENTEGGSLRDELKVLARRPVLLGLLTTVLGYAGVFAASPISRRS